MEVVRGQLPPELVQRLRQDVASEESLEEAKRLEGVRSCLLQLPEDIPLEASLLTVATQYQQTNPRLESTA